MHASDKREVTRIVRSEIYGEGSGCVWGAVALFVAGWMSVKLLDKIKTSDARITVLENRVEDLRKK